MSTFISYKIWREQSNFPRRFLYSYLLANSHHILSHNWCSNLYSGLLSWATALSVSVCFPYAAEILSRERYILFPTHVAMKEESAIICWGILSQVTLALSHWLLVLPFSVWEWCRRKETLYSIFWSFSCLLFDGRGFKNWIAIINFPREVKWKLTSLSLYWYNCIQL